MRRTDAPPARPSCAECAVEDATVFIEMKASVGGKPYWLCGRCWSRPCGELGWTDIRRRQA
jgi:hypothetical protein